MSGDDDLLIELGELARDARRPVDPRWDALARGELSDEERAALRAEEDADALAPLFEPLGEDFANALAAKVLAERAPASAKPEGEVVSLRARRGARVVRYALPGIALAAAALLYVLATGDPAGEPALPAYTVEVHGGDQALRGAPAASTERVRLSPGSRIEVVARPATPVTAPVAAEVTVRDASGATRPWTGGVEVAPSGAVRLTGTLGEDLVLSPGEATLEVTLRPRDAASGEEARILTVPILVVE